MNITKKKFGTNELLVKPEGRIDINSAPELENEVNKEIEGITYLTFDLADITYVSSIGLRVFLTFQKKMNAVGHMKIVNVRPEVFETFKITGFDKILDII